MAGPGSAKAFRQGRVAGFSGLGGPANMGVNIHPTAIVERGAELADGVEIGPFCTVGPRAVLAEGVKLISHVSIAGNTHIGARTVIYPFAAMGHPPQDLKYKGEDTRLRVGADNIIRESVTFHLGTIPGRSETIVGNKGFFMAGSHVGHDCVIGNGVVLGNHVPIGGVASIDDFVILGGTAAVHQFCRIGKYAFIGGGAPVVGDVIPFGMVDNHGRLHGLNLIGLKRRGFGRETINDLRAAYRELFLGEGHFWDRFASVKERYAGSPEVSMITGFIDAGEKRELCLPVRD
jgi:UDP-N-acetylglucosamine acyltransferase